MMPKNSQPQDHAQFYEDCLAKLQAYEINKQSLQQWIKSETLPEKTLGRLALVLTDYYRIEQGSVAELKKTCSEVRKLKNQWVGLDWDTLISRLSHSVYAWCREAEILENADWDMVEAMTRVNVDNQAIPNVIELPLMSRANAKDRGVDHDGQKMQGTVLKIKTMSLIHNLRVIKDVVRDVLDDEIGSLENGLQCVRQNSKPRRIRFELLTGVAQLLHHTDSKPTLAALGRVTSDICRTCGLDIITEAQVKSYLDDNPNMKRCISEIFSSS